MEQKIKDYIIQLEAYIHLHEESLKEIENANDIEIYKMIQKNFEEKQKHPKWRLVMSKEKETVKEFKDGIITSNQASIRALKSALHEFKNIFASI